MAKRYFIKNTKENVINYCDWHSCEEYAYKAIENRFKKMGVSVDVVKLVDGMMEIYFEGKLLTALQIVEQDLGDFWIADIAKGSLLKAYFDSPEEAITFMITTYDNVDFDTEDDLYSVIHKDTYIGTFDVVGGL
ncbi:MAG: hypothetical protein ACRCX2_16680 [Paraclostridium sp.]